MRILRTNSDLGEKEALLSQENHQPDQANKSPNNIKKKTVHILSATSVETPTGRVSDPCEVTILDRPHAYGACAHHSAGTQVNGGQSRTRRSVGVSTKDDLAVIQKHSVKKMDRLHPDSNNYSGLKFRLRSKFKNGGRRPSKETREVIDMGKLPSNNSTAKKKSPLNGILRKTKQGKDNITNRDVNFTPGEKNQHFYA